jgi:hypothetical protein
MLCGPLRAFRQRISLSRADSYCAKLAKKLGFGVVSKEGHPYMARELATIKGEPYDRSRRSDSR